MALVVSSTQGKYTVYRTASCSMVNAAHLSNGKNVYIPIPCFTALHASGYAHDFHATFN